MYTWHVVTIGHLSRNKYWGERDDTAYRSALATCTLISGGGQHILVDPALPENDMPQALLNAAGIAPEQITLVYSTHYHLDHHVSPLCFPNAQWLMPQTELDFLNNNWDEYIRSFPADNRENIAHCLPVSPGDELAPGIRIVPLPGHTKGICGLAFDAPEGRVLVTGDAVMTREFYKAGEPYLFGWEQDISRATIAALRGQYDVIVPGHGEAFPAARWEK